MASVAYARKMNAQEWNTSRRNRTLDSRNKIKIITACHADYINLVRMDWYQNKTRKTKICQSIQCG